MDLYYAGKLAHRWHAFEVASAGAVVAVHDAASGGSLEFKSKAQR